MDMPFPDFQQMMRTWLDFTTKMASAGGLPSPEPVPTDAAKQLRDMYFHAMGQYTEQFMRSPQFLEMTKQSMDLAVAFRQQTNDFLAQAHHAVGSLARSDIDGLLMAVRRCETRILDKLDEISARLDDIDRSVGAMQPAEDDRLSRKTR